MIIRLLVTLCIKGVIFDVNTVRERLISLGLVEGYVPSSM